MTGLSLVVATVGRTAEVQAFLDSLLPISGPGLDIIIADQNPDDRVARILRSHPVPTRHLRLDRPNASAARNAGAALARYGWLGFPDDDCRFLPDTLDHLIPALDKAPVVTGVTVDDAGRANILRWRHRSGPFDAWDMWRCMTESTLFVRRDLFTAIGGFDPDFGPGTDFPAAEGAEMLLRLFGAHPGLRGWFSRAIRIYHPTKIPPWTPEAVQRGYAYAVGEGGMLAKHPRPTCWWRTARYITKHSLAGMLPLGLRAACSRRKLGGLLHGYLTYRSRP